MSRIAMLGSAALAIVLGLAGAAQAQAPDERVAAPLAWGEPQTGSLGEGDWQIDGINHDSYRLMAEAGAGVEIVMRSDDFDTYLVVGRLDENGVFQEIARDDDGLGEGLNSRVRFVADEAGEYVVRARSFSSYSTQGTYTLQLTPWAGGSAPVGSIALGATVEGQLSETDATSEGEGAYDAFRFQGVAGQRIRIEARSDAFDTVVSLARYAGYGQFESLAFDDDGLGEGLNSALNFTLPADGTYDIRISSFGSEGTGAYSLNLIDRGMQPPPPPPGAISVGASVSGTLDENDGRTDEDYLYDDYRISLAEGGRISITLTSEDHDSFLRVGRYDEEGRFSELALDDDGGPGPLDSRLTFRPPEAGDYIIRATTYAPEAVGAYALDVRDLGPDPRPERLRLGRTVRGALTETDALSDIQQPYDVYSVRLRQGQRLSVAVTSESFTPVIFFAIPLSAGGYELINATDASLASEGRAELFQNVDQGGEYQIWVMAAGEGGLGDYSLTTRNLGRAPRAREVEPGDVIEGQLESGDRFLPSGVLYDVYRFDGEAGTRLRITMRSDEVDAFLALGLVEPDGVSLVPLVEDDDGLGEGTNSVIRFTLAVKGTYELWATSFASAEQGAYTVTIEDQGPLPEPGSLIVGSTVRGALADTDGTDEDGAFFDAYRFEAREGDRLRITATSNAFDTFLVLGSRGEDGTLEGLAVDDDGLSDTNSLIEHVVARDGVYEVWVRSYGIGETGDYVLTLEHGAEPEAAPAE